MNLVRATKSVSCIASISVGFYAFHAVRVHGNWDKSKKYLQVLLFKKQKLPQNGGLDTLEGLHCSCVCKFPRVLLYLILCQHIHNLLRETYLYWSNTIQYNIYFAIYTTFTDGKKK